MAMGIYPASALTPTDLVERKRPNHLHHSLPQGCGESLVEGKVLSSSRQFSILAHVNRICGRKNQQGQHGCRDDT